MDIFLRPTLSNLIWSKLCWKYSKNNIILFFKNVNRLFGYYWVWFCNSDKSPTKAIIYYWEVILGSVEILTQNFYCRTLWKPPWCPPRGRSPSASWPSSPGTRRSRSPRYRRCPPPWSCSPAPATQENDTSSFGSSSVLHIFSLLWRRRRI